MKYFLILLLTFVSSGAFAQMKSFKQEVDEFQRELNTEYREEKTSPLEPTARRKFKGHEFFTPDSSYRVVARVVILKNQEPFKMLTTKGTEKEFVRYAELHFTLREKEYKLTAYQGIELRKKEQYKDYLFVPFRDLTNGVSSYEGGRFMDLRIPSGETLAINFNKAYNPLCAYSNKYACPITPAENALDTEILAGVMLKAASGH